MKRPVLIILLVTAVLAGMGWPIFSIALGSTSTAALPKSAEARQGIDILNAQFPETNDNPIYVVVQAPGGSSMLTRDNLDKLDHLSKWIATQANVNGVISLTQLPATPGASTPSLQQLITLYSTGAYQQNPSMAQLVASTTNGNTSLITVMTYAKVDSSEGKALVNNLRAGDQRAGQGLAVLVGGNQADSLDFNNYLYSNFPRAVPFILVTTYILLLIMFRSVFLPLKAILMNVLSVALAWVCWCSYSSGATSAISWTSRPAVSWIASFPFCCSAFSSASQWTTRCFCSAVSARSGYLHTITVGL